MENHYNPYIISQHHLRLQNLNLFLWNKKYCESTNSLNNELKPIFRWSFTVTQYWNYDAPCFSILVFKQVQQSANILTLTFALIQTLTLWEVTALRWKEGLANITSLLLAPPALRYWQARPLPPQNKVSTCLPLQHKTWTPSSYKLSGRVECLLQWGCDDTLWPMDPDHMKPASANNVLEASKPAPSCAHLVQGSDSRTITNFAAPTQLMKNNILNWYKQERGNATNLYPFISLTTIPTHFYSTFSGTQLQVKQWAISHHSHCLPCVGVNQSDLAPANQQLHIASQCTNSLTPKHIPALWPDPYSTIFVPCSCVHSGGERQVINIIILNFLRQSKIEYRQWSELRPRIQAMEEYKKKMNSCENSCIKKVVKGSTVMFRAW